MYRKQTHIRIHVYIFTLYMYFTVHVYTHILWITYSIYYTYRKRIDYKNKVYVYIQYVCIVQYFAVYMFTVYKVHVCTVRDYCLPCCSICEQCPLVEPPGFSLRLWKTSCMIIPTAVTRTLWSVMIPLVERYTKCALRSPSETKPFYCDLFVIYFLNDYWGLVRFFWQLLVFSFLLL